MKKRLVVLTGAGISAESGLMTFRDSGGLWEGFDVMQVASIEGWHKNPALVLDFYNQRRHQALNAQPNAGHYALASLEPFFDVTIITQNVDILHEKSGSTKVVHLHGRLDQARSSDHPDDIFPWVDDLKIGQLASDGSQVRPHIVWFGEDVPKISEAIDITQQADVFAVIGTSLLVYPAAGLLHYVRQGTPIYWVDPNPGHAQGVTQVIAQPATTGVPMLASLLRQNFLVQEEPSSKTY